MLLIDAHVHIYDCFDLEKFFDSAYENFKSEAEKLGHADKFTGILLLAETSKDNWFQHLSDYADGKDLPEGKDTGNWIFRRTNENNSLFAESGDSKNLILIAGRQIVTMEGLEILASATSDNFVDDIPIEKLIEEIEKKDGLPVIPWGVGKWFGNRGKIVKNIIDNNNSSICLGDNGNRPIFWPEPRLFRLARKRGIRVLPGSDPLPFSTDHFKVGSFGFSINTSFTDEKPAASIINLILNSSIQCLPYGHLERNIFFIRNQLTIRLKS